MPDDASPGGTGSDILTREGLQERLRADRSSRWVVLFSFGSAVGWLLVGSLLGEVASLKLHMPDLLVSSGWMTFGRVRPAHLNAMVYGWASLGMIGVSCWLVPRLVHTRLQWRFVALAGVAFWNVGVLLGVLGILAGWTDGLEWLEMHRYVADPWLVVGGGLVGVPLLVTLARRQVDHLYVSVWYVISAYVWFPIIFIAGNWPTWRGVESAAVNWFYAHNALGLWLTAINLGAAYYFIPKVLGRPIYSYGLSLLGFWTLAFFYALNGMHHLIGGPVPEWMITTSIVASVLMVIPVFAVAINHHMTMVGRFEALRYSPTLRFIVLGSIAYTAVSLQGIFTAFRAVNRVTHFTHWTIAHAHVGVYGFVTFVLFGSMYYVLPRVTGREWPSGRLIGWHFWLTLGGLALYVVPLTIAGVFQGMALLDPQVSFQVSVARAYWGLVARSMAGIILTIGHMVFAWHCWLLLRQPVAGGAFEARSPLVHVRPIVFAAPISRRDASRGTSVSLEDAR